ncbi:MORC family CW-type zinc finger protein 3-like isoform X1 [Astyanax mexicanus]|uniref:MORC family CW-type zinc finger protein 3-like isoform X1 n=1 Tax=Astyanax mexicanus TaxID=7994 RepID=A0A8T2M8P6_ASTMX|nr:MORC family CW-type zinc finger protein 3-like isoform X1 [Astyanax mexicanus]
MRKALTRQFSAIQSHAHNFVLLADGVLGFTWIIAAMEEKWDTMYEFLAVGTYPDGYTKSQRQNLRRYASKFQIKGQ